MKHISLDIETYSSVDLSKSSVYRYSEAPDFEILLFGYSVDDAPVQVVDLAIGERIPEEILTALTDERVTKWAFNANFERVCLSRYLGLPNDEFLDPAQWRCTMIWSAYLGLPLSLMGVGAALSLDKQKMSEGKELIRYFCQPCAATKTNGGRTRNLPQDAPENGRFSKRITCGMWKRRWVFKSVCAGILCRRMCGSNTIRIRRSTTGASPSTGSWWKAPFRWTCVPAPS